MHGSVPCSACAGEGWPVPVAAGAGFFVFSPPEKRRQEIELGNRSEIPPDLQHLWCCSVEIVLTACLAQALVLSMSDIIVTAADTSGPSHPCF